MSAPTTLPIIGPITSFFREAKTSGLEEGELRGSVDETVFGPIPVASAVPFRVSIK